MKSRCMLSISVTTRSPNSISNGVSSSVDSGFWPVITGASFIGLIINETIPSSLPPAMSLKVYAKASIPLHSSSGVYMKLPLSDDRLMVPWSGLEARE